MSQAQYRFTTHADLPDVVPQLTRLSNLAFAEYEGAMPVDESFIAWYLRRPGCRPELCPVAMAGDEMVSNVLVAIEDLQLGGGVFPCGIIDTVATDPAHRRQGLARKLMDQAHEVIREAGADAAVLYTNPDGHPYKFYQSLGYETRAFGAAMVGPRPSPAPAVELNEMPPQAMPAVRGMIDVNYAGYEGYAPITDDLWRWHREDRPQYMPIRLLAGQHRSSGSVSTLAIAQVDVLLEGGHVPTAVISDFAATHDHMTHLQALISAATAERVMAIVDVEAPLYVMLQELGFSEAVREVAMVLPFSERARRAMQRKSGPWYVMIESVVGV